IALAEKMAQLCVVGRDATALNETLGAAKQSSAKAFQADLTVTEDIESLVHHVGHEFGRVDVVVHCAGLVSQSRLQHAQIEDLDREYFLNVRAPYLLTQALLPFLKTSRGQVVFVNSSAGLTARRPEIGQYAATKHALRAIADSLREE